MARSGESGAAEVASPAPLTVGDVVARKRPIITFIMSPIRTRMDAYIGTNSRNFSPISSGQK